MSAMERLKALGGVAAIVADIRGTWDDTTGPGLTPEAEELGRITETAVLVVCQYAPGAPAVVLKEAAARTAAYLWNMNRGPLVRERVGNQEAEVNVTRHAAFRHSGAMSLVSPWKVRRAGSIA